MSLLPYLMIVAGLISTLALFVTLKFEISRNARRQKRRVEEMMIRLAEAEKAPPAPPEPEPEIAMVPMLPRAGLNLTKRVHALRMLRRGEDVAHVAAALGVPRKEVELLIRVQAIGKARAVNAAGTD
jgi:hypothetical protein